jgi:hypothetical protein
MTYTCSDAVCSTCGYTNADTYKISEAAWAAQGASDTCYKWQSNPYGGGAYWLTTEYYKATTAATLPTMTCIATTTTEAPGQLGAPGTALSGFIAMALIAVYQLW